MPREPLHPATPYAEDSMEGPVGPGRLVLPDTRYGITHKFTVVDDELKRQSLYLTGNRYEGVNVRRVGPDVTYEEIGDADAPLGETFLVGFGKEGSTLDGMTQWAMICLSIALQSGADPGMMFRKFAHMNFRPFGRVEGHPEIPDCHSIPGYVGEYLARKFCDEDLWLTLAEIRAELRP